MGFKKYFGVGIFFLYFYKSAYGHNTHHNMDSSFLDFLPPPPSVDTILAEPARKTRGPTRQTIASLEQLIVDDVVDDEAIEPVAQDPNSDEERTRNIMHARNSRNEAVLMKVSMEESRVNIRVVPTMLKRNGRRYPEKCATISCWWCKSRFSTRPIGCPYKFCRNTKIYRCEGFFCSYSCAKAYGISCGRESMRFCGSLLVKLRKEIDGVAVIEPMDSAPHWSALKSFGGYMSLETFRGLQKMSYRIKAIPENLKCFAYGFNLFTHENKSDRTVRTFKVLRDRWAWRKTAPGEERARKRRLNDSVSKVMNRIKCSRKSAITVKVKHISSFLAKKNKKKVLTI